MIVTKELRPGPRKHIGWMLLFLLSGAIVAALAFAWHILPGPTLPGQTLPDEHSGAGQRPVADRAVTARGNLAADEQSTIEIFEKSRDAVVFISTTQLARNSWTRNVFAIPRGTGTGLLWDDAGHVITNYHLIAGADSAMVKLSDGHEYKAVLVGASPPHDIAVLSIDTGVRTLRNIPIGTSKDLKVGQKVFAIGNPFGLDWTLTSGIISALDRSLTSDESGSVIEHLIQTDAAINPGNSGGPLLDSAGRLIGMNVAIYSPSGGSAGIGFAIPTDTLMRVVPQLISGGQYRAPALGIETDAAINRILAKQSGVEGVFVLRVQRGSAADKAGLTGLTFAADDIVPGDVITAVEGKQVISPAELIARLDDFQVGSTVRLSVQAAGNKRARREVRVSLQ
jgi:S1-C subfamily serine protease